MQASTSPSMHACMEAMRSFEASWLSRQWEVKPCRSGMGGGHVRIGEVDESHASFGGPAGHGVKNTVRLTCSLAKFMFGCRSRGVVGLALAESDVELELGER
jgi:hypothetical protein